MYCKLNKCTVNDYTTSLIGSSLHEYFEKHPHVGGIPKSVLFTMPFSMRMPVLSLKDVKMRNEANGVCLELPIRKDIKEILPIF